MIRLVSLTVILLWLGAAPFGCKYSARTSSKSELTELHSWSLAMGDSTPYEDLVRSVRRDAAAESSAHAVWQAMRVRLSSTLGRLGYGTGPFTWEYGDRERQAFARFQKDMGLPATGTPDAATAVQLINAERALALPDIVLPEFGFYAESGLVGAHGTWKAVSNALGFPVNTVDVECDASSGFCEVASVDLIDGELSQLGRIHRQRYRITHWSDTDLLATGEDWPGSPCHATLSINFRSKDVVVHQWCTEMNGLDGEKLPSSEMTLKLVDGRYLSPPFDGGDLKEVHAQLYGQKLRFLELQRKNMALPVE